VPLVPLVTSGVLPSSSEKPIPDLPPASPLPYLGSMEAVMKETHVAKAGISISASADRVWKALTDPELIKQYLFGTEASSDWKEGSPIIYKGVWEGKAYEDKGRIVRVVPRELLVTTYWSGFSGLPDVPENYSTVTYRLASSEEGTTLVIEQDNNPTRESAEHSEGNWEMVLKSMKELLEK
jgi:uncharacterized protein YndB with AHSA1/START domain